MSDLPITLFADFTSAGSYVTEAALWRRAAEEGVEVECRAVEIDPAVGPEGEAEGEGDIRELAEALGLPFLPPGIRPRTGKAHEAARFARERGAEEALRHAVYRAYWGEGADIGRIDVLQAIGAEVGLDPFELKVALDIDRYREEILRDREIARRLGIRRVPVVYLGTGPSARILTGARSADDLEAEIRRARG